MLRGSSSKVSSKESLPKNPVLLKMFLSIHVETDPLKINKSLGLFLKFKSQADLSLPRKVGSREPIQLISSKTRITLPSSVCLERCQKISPQSSLLSPGTPSNRVNCCTKYSRCILSVVFSSGGSPMKMRVLQPLLKHGQIYHLSKTPDLAVLSAN